MCAKMATASLWWRITPTGGYTLTASTSHRVGRCRAVRTQRWKYGVVAPDCDPSAAGSDHYVETYLFDLMADPYELDNLIGYRSHTHVAARLRERLISRMIDAGEAPPTIAVSPERDSGQLHIEPAEAEL